MIAHSATVTFAGMAPGFVGLIRVDLQVPNLSGHLPETDAIKKLTSNTPAHIGFGHG
jgi:uncharacterized protein (TIGR03437 family)